MILDKLGNEIRIGDYIAYGHALGRCAGLRIGRVLDIKPRKDWRDEEGVSITVRGIDDDWSKKELCKKNGTLLYPDRVIVLRPNMLDSERRDLLDEIS